MWRQSEFVFFSVLTSVGALFCIEKNSKLFWANDTIESKIMKLLIAGSRSIKNFDLTKYVPPNTTLIISGGATGIDTLAEKFADTHIIPKQIILPDYSLYGKQAPIVRNKLMVDLADSVLVIWDGKSHGAKITADYAKKLNKLLNNIII